MIFVGPASTSTAAKRALTNASSSDPTTTYFAEYEPPDGCVELQKWTRVVEATLRQSVIVSPPIDHSQTDRAGYENCDNITKFD
jgi:hypothetical protein